MYLYQLRNWPDFTWDDTRVARLLAEIRYLQGRLLGKMESLGFTLQDEATLQTITQDVVKSSEIEGEILNAEQVRSSIARKLGLDVGGLVPSNRYVDGVVEMMLDATQHNSSPITSERLFGWHNALFPQGRSGMSKITVGGWRTNTKDDPMQVVSGAMGRETVHYQAPDSDLIEDEMNRFISWFNNITAIDPVIKAGVAHLWFVTIHPFDDGNGRIARAITDMQLARADGTTQRFYSMSSQVRLERNRYYEILEKTQKASMDITEWLEWFLGCFGRAVTNTEQALQNVVGKAKFWDNPATTNLNKRQRYMLDKLWDGFFGKLTSSKWAKMAKCSQITAIRDIQELVNKGLLKKEDAGGRSTAYSLNTGD